MAFDRWKFKPRFEAGEESPPEETFARVRQYDIERGRTPVGEPFQPIQQPESLIPFGGGRLPQVPSFGGVIPYPEGLPPEPKVLGGGYTQATGQVTAYDPIPAILEWHHSNVQQPLAAAVVEIARAHAMVPSSGFMSPAAREAESKLIEEARAGPMPFEKGFVQRYRDEELPPGMKGMLEWVFGNLPIYLATGSLPVLAEGQLLFSLGKLSKTGFMALVNLLKSSEGLGKAKEFIRGIAKAGAREIVERTPVLPGQPQPLAFARVPGKGGKPVPPAKPAGVAKPAVKEPWQMTLDEFKDRLVQTKSDVDIGYHKTTVRKALSEGKPVSPEVLKDYPELAKGAPAKPAPAKPAVVKPPAGVKPLISKFTEADKQLFIRNEGKERGEALFKRANQLIDEGFDKSESFEIANREISEALTAVAKAAPEAKVVKPAVVEPPVIPAEVVKPAVVEPPAAAKAIPEVITPIAEQPQPLTQKLLPEAKREAQSLLNAGDTFIALPETTQLVIRPEMGWTSPSEVFENIANIRKTVSAGGKAPPPGAPPPTAPKFDINGIPQFPENEFLLGETWAKLDPSKYIRQIKRLEGRLKDQTEGIIGIEIARAISKEVPIKFDSKGFVNLGTDIKSSVVGASRAINDILEFPEKYIFSPRMQTFLDEFYRTANTFVKMVEKEGIIISKRQLAPGEVHISRFVKGKKVTPQQIIESRKLSSPEKRRVWELAETAMDESGIIYESNPINILDNIGQWAGRKIVSKRVREELKTISSFTNAEQAEKLYPHIGQSLIEAKKESNTLHAEFRRLRLIEASRKGVSLKEKALYLKQMKNMEDANKRTDSLYLRLQYIYDKLEKMEFSTVEMRRVARKAGIKLTRQEQTLGKSVEAERQYNILMNEAKSISNTLEKHLQKTLQSEEVVQNLNIYHKDLQRRIIAKDLELRALNVQKHDAIAKIEGEYATGRVGIPGLTNRIYVDFQLSKDKFISGEQIADKINKTFKPQIPAALKWSSAYNNIARMGIAAIDDSAAFIQLIGLTIRRPGIWGSAWLEGTKAIAIPKQFYHLLSRDPAMMKAAMELNYHRGLLGGTEFFQASRGLAKFLKSIPVAGDALSWLELQTFERFAQAFATTRNYGAIKLWQASRGIAKTPKELRNLGESINILTGVFSLRGQGISEMNQSLLNTFAFFASRYQASVASVMFNTFRPTGGIKSRMAKEYIIPMVIGGTLIYIATAKALGQEPKLDPRPKSVGGDGADFMTLEFNGVRTGIGSGIISALRLVAYVAGHLAAGEPVEAFFDNVRWVRGHSSTLSGRLWDFTEGRDFLGRAVRDNWAQAGAHLGISHIPIWTQSLAKGEPAIAGGLEAAGLRTFPISLRDRLARKEFQKEWRELQPWQKATLQVLPEYDELMKEYPIRGRERISYQLRKDFGTEQELRDQAFLNRFRTTGEPFGPREWREETSKSLAALAGAREVRDDIYGKLDIKPKTEQERLLREYIELKDKFRRPDGSYDFEMAEEFLTRFMEKQKPEDQKYLEDNSNIFDTNIQKEKRLDTKLYKDYYKIDDIILERWPELTLVVERVRSLQIASKTTEEYIELRKLKQTDLYRIFEVISKRAKLHYLENNPEVYKALHRAGLIQIPWELRALRR